MKLLKLAALSWACLLLLSCSGSGSQQADSYVNITLMPPAFGICIQPNQYSFQELGLNEIRSTWVPGVGPYFKIWNCGGLPLNLTIAGTNASSADGNLWILSSSPGYNRYLLEYSLNNTAEAEGEYRLILLSISPLGSLPEPDDSFHLDLRITTPIQSGSYRQHFFQVIIGAYLA